MKNKIPFLLKALVIWILAAYCTSLFSDFSFQEIFVKVGFVMLAIVIEIIIIISTLIYGTRHHKYEE
jgi:membrane protein YdbS with pleckstrin-like domain